MSLLAVQDLSKRYGAVVALRSANLAVEPGEIHALLGANGAGKSTLVKMLTGVIRPDGGAILVRERPVRIQSPASAQRAGLAAVFQDPALVPDLTVLENYRLTGTDIGAARRWLVEMALDHLDLGELVSDVPLPALRMLDLARALARDPQLLLLDEITAALPSDLAERVFGVMRRWREQGRSVLFISHRLAEVRAVCDRATVLRDGRDVGTLIPSRDGEEKIVDLMLGPVAHDVQDAQEARDGAIEPALARGEGQAATARETSNGERLHPSRYAGPSPLPPAGEPVGPADPRTWGTNPHGTGVRASAGAGRMPAEGAFLQVERLRSGAAVSDVSLSLRTGEILGVAALEGQGQDVLFDLLAGRRRPDGGTIRVNGAALRARSPYDAIRAGMVLVPSDRLQALLPQRSIRENVAAPLYNRPMRWGPINVRAEARRVAEAVTRLSIDTRAQRQARRLSGGNQQKVTIARWLASGFRVMLLFDPTRGIDVGTKRQIYALLRELAEGGAAVLLFTSELPEIQLVCDRVLVLYEGRVVREMPAAEADEGALLRAAHGLTRAEEAVV